MIKNTPKGRKFNFSEYGIPEGAILEFIKDTSITCEVTSDSNVNGASALYTFTVTFSVDTEVNSLIMVTVPPEIEYDSSRNFTCRGLLGLIGKKIRCEALRPGKVFTVNVWSDI